MCQELFIFVFPQTKAQIFCCWLLKVVFFPHCACFTGKLKNFFLNGHLVKLYHHKLILNIGLLVCLEVEKAMAPHCSTLAWEILWTEEPGRLQSMGSLRVRHDWAASLSLFTFMHWRRKWQPTPVFLPGESQGRRSLVGCRLWGRTELDTTEAT